ncbi:MAG: glycerol-3-phosphate 1-O-acyltransferase PlsY [Verrucomicrobia bacterium]|nr:glycerol-3-phosphate 1-O-acyltransferase PlsY [Verrucomicrobiota bacterium]MBV8377639.1 glycerol-3-phosphate 1-O-acyltransferase PlsY [Verrucomicrobiota bacterium]
MIWLLIALVSYLLGSLPSGYLVARSQDVDIRQQGSKNIGATNVLRVMGKKWGYLVFFCDSFKGFLSVKLGILIAAHSQLSPVLGGVIAAISCILGHNYTFWLGFKGGKGIATSGGVVLALFPVLVIICVALVWVVLFYLAKYVSLASIAAAVALPFAVFLIVAKTGVDFWTLFAFSVLIAAMAIWRHQSNIVRLMNGTESRFGKK